MDREFLKDVIVDQREAMEAKLRQKDIIQREGGDNCEKFVAHPNVLLISGLRRAGKSIFAHQLAQKYKYAYINFDDERLLGIEAKDLNQVLECFYELYHEFDILLLDEIQNVAGWELFVNRLRENHRVVITGSNANLLSKELATHLTGRYLEFTLYPLSFREYLDYSSYKLTDASLHSTKSRSQLSVLFSKFLMDGGIFEYFKFGGEFLRTLFSSIINKDIVVRYKIKHSSLFEELALLLVNSFACKVSINKLTNSLKIKSFNTTKEYLKYLENSFLVFTTHKFSYKLKEQFSSLKKVYVIDNGLINSLTAAHSQNKGRLLENMVAIGLKRRSHISHHKIFYWDNYNVECDFIVKADRKITAAYQVCSQIMPENREREYAGLIGALKEFQLKEGTILTDSEEREEEVEGKKIHLMPVWKWMLKEC